MRFVGVCYRVLTPFYSSTPLSGEGARLKGGRFNPIGTPALYLSLDAQVAAREAAHGFKGLVAPKMICSYDVDIENVADFRTSKTRTALGVSLRSLKCAWELDLSNGQNPQTWPIVEDLIKSGYHGVLVPSFAATAEPDDVNLVLWKWGDNAPHRVTVYDPNSDLPTDQSSWKPSP